MKLLARPVKWRRVEFLPSVNKFIPLTQNGRPIGENTLHIEELEAIRLKDLEGLEQEECAKKMEVSRQTFQRILNNARLKIADSLIKGKTVKIEGGNFTFNICNIKCNNCGNQWEESFENLKNTIVCPECDSKNIVCIQNNNKSFCRRNCHRHGRQR